MIKTKYQLVYIMFFLPILVKTNKNFISKAKQKLKIWVQ